MWQSNIPDVFPVAPELELGQGNVDAGLQFAHLGLRLGPHVHHEPRPRSEHRGQLLHGHAVLRAEDAHPGLLVRGRRAAELDIVHQLRHAARLGLGAAPQLDVPDPALGPVEEHHGAAVAGPEPGQDLDCLERLQGADDPHHGPRHAPVTAVGHGVCRWGLRREKSSFIVYHYHMSMK